jgi:hypothetical protein
LDGVEHVQIIKVEIVHDLAEGLVLHLPIEVDHELLIFACFLRDFVQEYLLEVNRLGRNDGDVWGNLLAIVESWLLVPEWLLLGIDLCMADLDFAGSWVWTRAWGILHTFHAVSSLQFNVIIHLFVWRATRMDQVLGGVAGSSRVLDSILGLFGLLRSEEALEDNVGELPIHEWIIDVDEDATGFRLNNTDVVHTAWADTDHFLVHEGFDELGSLANCLDAVIICRLERGRWHQRRDHGNIFVVMWVVIV